MKTKATAVSVAKCGGKVIPTRGVGCGQVPGFGRVWSVRPRHPLQQICRSLAARHRSPGIRQRKAMLNSRTSTCKASVFRGAGGASAVRPAPACVAQPATQRPTLPTTTPGFSMGICARPRSVVAAANGATARDACCAPCCAAVGASCAALGSAASRHQPPNCSVGSSVGASLGRLGSSDSRCGGSMLPHGVRAAPRRAFGRGGGGDAHQQPSPSLNDYVEVKVDSVRVSAGASVVFLRLCQAPDLVLPVHIGENIFGEAA
eukprot:155972-Chlamydomonas_euryale.AAC.4